MQRLQSVDWVLIAMVFPGLLGIILFVDEFDDIRMTAASFVGMPAVVAWFFLRFHYPVTLIQWKKLRFALLLAITCCFGWGNILLLNAVGDGQQPVEVAQQIGSVTGSVAHLRGPLGIIYRPRF
jgi:hypothetical protein